MIEENNVIYTIEEIKQETDSVTTLFLSSENKNISYIAGQYITIFLPETGHKEGKAYSISSAPSEKRIAITVKEIGFFSKAIIAKKRGEEIEGSLPCGYFYGEQEESPLVLIASGIAITPFRSMIIESSIKNPKRKIILLYVNKNKQSIIFKKEFDDLKEKMNGVFDVVYYITQEDVVSPMKKGRIPLEDILAFNKESSLFEFFLCGSIAFVRDYWKGLKNGGISEDVIYTEAFF